MIAAVIPIKRLSEGKTRLSPELSQAERGLISLGLLHRTVGALRDSKVVDRIALATPQVELAGDLGMEIVPEAAGLNETLERAARWAMRSNAESLLIVPADLPFIHGDAIRDVLQEARQRRGLVIAPTRDGGTGSLVLTPPNAILPSFGPGSFRRHLKIARAQDVPVTKVNMPEFAFDLDEVEDLDLLKASPLHFAAPD